MNRGVLYVVWGDGMESLLKRSQESVQRFYPGMPMHVVRGQEDPVRGLQQKASLIAESPFESTLFLDADTVVTGNLDYAFEKSEQFGLACCICECPWTRRYDQAEGDNIEYNTGVLFFSTKARPVFETWKRIAPTHPSSSSWTALDGQTGGLAYDDQASFAKAIQQCGFNPHVLPLNYNFRPNLQRIFFAPLKIWHDPREIPPELVQVSEECEKGQRPVTWVRF